MLPYLLSWVCSRAPRQSPRIDVSTLLPLGLFLTLVIGLRDQRKASPIKKA